MDKFSFVKDGATAWRGGYTERKGKRIDKWYVTGGNGIKFEVCPYRGWLVEKNATNYEGRKIQHRVTDSDAQALDAYVESISIDSVKV